MRFETPGLIYSAHCHKSRTIFYAHHAHYLRIGLMHHYRVTILGTDPVNRKNNINGLSYQQDALTTYNGWQYAVFYASKTHAPEPLYLHLARRPLARDDWEVLVFQDYEQVTDDGHNTAQLGICRGDGSIHLSYDHHCDKCDFPPNRESFR